MRVNEFCQSFREEMQPVEIWDVVEMQSVFEGTMEEASVGEYRTQEIESWSFENGVVVVNIEEDL